MQDLPIGIDPDGADAWAWQDVLAINTTVGVPPDQYNTKGQNWGMPPFVPHKLRAAGHEPFRQTIRANLRHARGLRIDHGMGLFRLFWIPAGADPSLGAFVQYPGDELLAIVALESHRAKALIVGEDLGTVEADIQARFDAHRILSYRLLWFETHLPSQYPELALAAVTTYDLPTIAGLWSGADLRIQHALGLQPNTAGLREIREQLRGMTNRGLVIIRSGCLEKRFQTDAEVQRLFLPIPQRELIDEHGAQGKAAGVDQPLGRYLTMHIEDSLELFIEIFNRVRAQRVQEATHLDPIIRMRIGTAARGDHCLACLRTDGIKSWVVVVLVTQDIAHLGRQLRQQCQRLHVIGHVRGGQVGCQRNPHACDGRHQVQLPPVDPPVPARLGPVRLRINRRVGNQASLAILLMPDPAAGAQERAVDGDRPPARRPRLDHGHQRSAQTPNLRRQARRDGVQASLPGTACGKAAVDRQQRAQGLHLWGGLSQHTQQGMHGVQMPHNHDDQGLQKQPVRIPRRAATAAPCRRGRAGHPAGQFHQGDKQRVVFYHGGYLRIVNGVVATMMPRWPREGQALARPFNL